MKIVITEQQYNEVLLIENYIKELYTNILKENEEPHKNTDMIKEIIKEVLNEVGVALKFVFTFGTGITALIGPITSLLEAEGLNPTNKDVILLIITSLAILLSESKDDIRKLYQALEEKGLTHYLNNTTKFIRSTKNLAMSVGSNLGLTVSGLSDLFGYTALLLPIMDILDKLINNQHIGWDDLPQVLAGLTMGAGAYTLKTFLEKKLRK